MVLHCGCFMFLIRLPHNSGQWPGIISRVYSFSPRLLSVRIVYSGNREETKAPAIHHWHSHSEEGAGFAFGPVISSLTT